tara:strand:- start:3500 stop:4108 length:609 start_codon:yes stop_codon:yes gene_type:complete
MKKINPYLIPGLKRFEFAEKPPVLDKQSVIDVICDYFHVSLDILSSKTRKREICEPRQITMYLLRKHTSLTCKSIASIFSKDHATVIHGCKSISNLIQVDRELKKNIGKIEDILEVRDRDLLHINRIKKLVKHQVLKLGYLEKGEVISFLWKHHTCNKKNRRYNIYGSYKFGENIWSNTDNWFFEHNKSIYFKISNKAVFEL